MKWEIDVSHQHFRYFDFIFSDEMDLHLLLVISVLKHLSGKEACALGSMYVSANYCRLLLTLGKFGMNGWHATGTRAKGLKPFLGW